jgi:hypothetical protein
MAGAVFGDRLNNTDGRSCLNTTSSTREVEAKAGVKGSYGH